MNYTMISKMGRLGGAAVALAALAALLSGCPFDSSSGSSGGAVSNAMVIDEEYVVDTHSRIVNTGLDPARIEITHQFDDGLRTAILREGSADLF